MILLHLAIGADFRAYIWLVENLAVVQPLGLPVIDRGAHFELIDAANHFRNATEAKLRHGFAHFRRDVFHEVDDSRGISVELLAEFGILRGYTDWAGVLVADAHHQAT